MSIFEEITRKQSISAELFNKVNMFYTRVPRLLTHRSGLSDECQFITVIF